MSRKPRRDLEALLRTAGASDPRQQRKLLEDWGWTIRLREDPQEIVGDSEGRQISRPSNPWVKVKPELATLQQRAIGGRRLRRRGSSR